MDKVSKDKADYHGLSPKMTQQCDRCTMFRAPDRCTTVAGEIEPAGWCKYYEQRKK